MKRKIITIILMLTIIVLTAYGQGSMRAEGIEQGGQKVNAMQAEEPSIDYEMSEKRSRFIRQFALSDGSFLAVSYSMPVHYKKNGKWAAIDTTMKKAGKKAYSYTKSTDLKIHAAVSNRIKRKNKNLISLKRGNTKLSFKLLNEKQRKVRAIVSNPKKKKQTDVLNENKVRYPGIIKNTNIIYDIYPERVTERIQVSKKEKKAPKYTFKLDFGKLKAVQKKGRIYFQTKKGTAKYKRLTTIFTDAKGVSTAKGKITFDKKKKKITIKPDKKWWNDKKRKFPVTIRTSYVTDKHEREVKIGAAYAGAPDTNFTYDTALLSKAKKCTSYVQMTYLSGLTNPNVKIRKAELHIKNEEVLEMGAGKTFDLNIHRITKKWSGKSLTYNHRPSYDKEVCGSFSVQKRKEYACDITSLVQNWYAGVPNYGVALIADKSNGAYQARLNRNPYIAIRYEVVGFSGACELKEGQDITRDVVKERQENYYYFDAKPGIAYDLYTTSALDTQGSLYDESKERLAFDENSGEGENFAFVGSYDGRRYLKVSTKTAAVGQYTLSLKPRFEIPVVTGKKAADGYELSWQAVEHAKEYVVTVYNGSGVYKTFVTTEPSYLYSYDEETRGKTLAFMVTPRENETLKGEPSEKIYNTSVKSEWNYETPMAVCRSHAATAVLGENLYVLGGVAEAESAKTMEVYNLKTGAWSKAADYPGTLAGLYQATMLTVGDELYVLGGQSDMTGNAIVTKEVYAYRPATDTWTKKADMPVEGSGVIAAYKKGNIYVFAASGQTERVDVYQISTNAWKEPQIKADTSTTILAQTVKGRIFVLREKQKDGNLGRGDMQVCEYLTEENEYDEGGSICPFSAADFYTSGCNTNGNIYFVNEKQTNHAICYDVFRDAWSEVSVFNLEKSASSLAAADGILYSLGGELAGFGSLDVMESLNTSEMTKVKTLDVVKGEKYELQLYGGNIEKNTDYTITITVDPEVLAFSLPSSFLSEEEFKEGKDGIRLVKYEPDNGVMVVLVQGKMESGSNGEVIHSIPVTGLVNASTQIGLKVNGGQYEK